MSNNFLGMRKNKKAQVGETLTWFISTIIIIFILLVAVYAASILGKARSLSDSGKIDDSEENWIKVKNDLGFENNDSNKEKINLWLEKNSLEDS